MRGVAGESVGVRVIREQVVVERGAEVGRGRARRGSAVESAAYRGGWRDGRFSPVGSFADNANLALWEGHDDRLAYYRGYRDGLRVREMLAGA
jgi:hypothetical protein